MVVVSGNELKWPTALNWICCNFLTSYLNFCRCSSSNELSKSHYSPCKVQEEIQTGGPEFSGRRAWVWGRERTGERVERRAGKLREIGEKSWTLGEPVRAGKTRRCRSFPPSGPDDGREANAGAASPGVPTPGVRRSGHGESVPTSSAAAHRQHGRRRRLFRTSP